MRRVARAAGPVSSYAVCVCAYNEESVIEEKVRNLLELRRNTPLPVEIYVYVDAATDGTAAILRPYADRLHLIEAAERHGKSAGMNRLVEMASADVVVFSDANVMMEADALTRLAPYFDDTTVGCVCGHLIYTNHGETPTSAVGCDYWRSEERLKQLESDTGSVIGADGSIFAIRRSLHRPVPEDIIDDFYLSLSILCDGHRVIRAGDVRAMEASATESADEFRRKVRIACQAFNVHRLLRKRIRTLHWSIRYKYFSHKVLRWLSFMNGSIACAFFLLGLLIENGAPAAFSLLGAGTVGLALSFSDRAGPLRRLREILLALVATSVGVVRSLKGDRFQTWCPPASRVSRATNP